MRRVSTVTQLERQNELTRVLLVMVSGLPLLNDEVLAALFGRTMAMRNWLNGLSSFDPSSAPVSEILTRRLKKKTEQRAYWRMKQRERRERPALPI